MASKHDLKTYGESKIIVEQVPKIVNIINDFTIKLFPYDHYKPVNNILNMIEDSRFELLWAYDNNYESWANKGEFSE